MSIKKLIIKTQRKALQIAYGFDRWHVSPLYERPYASDIITYCNRRKERNDFVEIGCGLGDIIRHVDYTVRTGYDNDEKVLKAARILPSKTPKGRSVTFEVFNFPQNELNSRYDVITMVNWIHHIEPVILKKYIEQYFQNNLTDTGEIVIDTVQDKAYRFNHNIEFLSGGINSSIHKIGEYARHREVFVIKKT